MTPNPTTPPDEQTFVATYDISKTVPQRGATTISIDIPGGKPILLIAEDSQNAARAVDVMASHGIVNVRPVRSKSNYGLKTDPQLAADLRPLADAKIIKTKWLLSHKKDEAVEAVDIEELTITTPHSAGGISEHLRRRRALEAILRTYGIEFQPQCATLHSATSCQLATATPPADAPADDGGAEAQAEVVEPTAETPRAAT